MNVRAIGFVMVGLAASALGAASCSGSTDNPFGDGGGGGGGDATPGADSGGNPCGAQAQCGGKCVDTATDPQNCGACAKACGAKEACAKGACVPCTMIDADKDGVNACDDCNDNDPSVRPGAFDVPGNGVDDDCDGKIDDVATCDTGLASDSSDPLDMAKAMDICDKNATASWPTLADARAHQVAADWGSVFMPRLGASLAALSSGIAADKDDTKPMFDGAATPQQGTDFGKTGATFPVSPMSFACGNATYQDPATANDYTELKVQLVVPVNARSFAIDAAYLTAEAPEAVCGGTWNTFDDPAFILLDSQAFKGNVATGGAHGRALSVKSGLLTRTTGTALAGTGMDKDMGNGALAGSATDWMTFEAPVVPGETITLRFVVMDLADGVMDTQLLVDHFRWQTKMLCGPMGDFDGGATGCPDGGVADASGQ